MAKGQKAQFITPEELGQMLYEEFDKDSWGEVEPFYFGPGLEETKDEGCDMEGLFNVLARVSHRINNKWLRDAGR